MPEGPEITRLLRESREGNREAMDALLSAVYPELRKIAASSMRRHGGGPHTLQPTALLHEAYLKLAGNGGEFRDRGHFFAVSASAMRQILVDHARAKNSQKRGAGAPRVQAEEAVLFSADDPELLLFVDEALRKLAAHDARKARVLELRYFGGLSVEETAEAVGVSVATVGRELRFAEAWLKREMGG